MNLDMGLTIIGQLIMKEIKLLYNASKLRIYKIVAESELDFAAIFMNLIKVFVDNIR